MDETEIRLDICVSAHTRRRLELAKALVALSPPFPTKVSMADAVAFLADLAPLGALLAEAAGDATVSNER